MNNTGLADNRFYDPNLHVAPDDIEIALSFSCFAFRRARIEPRGMTDPPVNSFLYAEAGTERHLVYVRVTQNDEQEDGPGPMPGILIDQALELDAKPHVVRVHSRPGNDGIGREYSYFGHGELERKLKVGDWWQRQVLHGRTARDYLRITGGRPSKLEVLVKHDPPGVQPQCDSWEDNPLLEGMVITEPEEPPPPYRGSVELQLRVDTKKPVRMESFISIRALVQSTYLNDEHYIFTCSCGVPGCSSIWAGVDVAREDGLVVWRMRGNKPRRVLVFDREQYRQEIFAKVRTALALHKEMGPDAFIGANDWRAGVESALYYAEDPGL